MSTIAMPARAFEDSMVSQDPWLAKFIESSLDAWFLRLEWTACDEYESRKTDENLMLWRKDSYVGIVRLLKVNWPPLVTHCGN